VRPVRQDRPAPAHTCAAVPWRQMHHRIGRTPRRSPRSAAFCKAAGVDILLRRPGFLPKTYRHRRPSKRRSIRFACVAAGIEVAPARSAPFASANRGHGRGPCQWSCAMARMIRTRFTASTPTHSSAENCARRRSSQNIPRNRKPDPKRPARVMPRSIGYAAEDKRTHCADCAHGEDPRGLVTARPSAPHRQSGSEPDRLSVSIAIHIADRAIEVGLEKLHQSRSSGISNPAPRPRGDSVLHVLRTVAKWSGRGSFRPSVSGLPNHPGGPPNPRAPDHLQSYRDRCQQLRRSSGETSARCGG